MSRLLILVVSFCALLSVGYTQEFSGIAVDGNLDEVISKFSQKGFQLKSDKLSNKPVISMSGYSGQNRVELFIAYHPTSKEVWRFSVYLPEAKD